MEEKIINLRTLKNYISGNQKRHVSIRFFISYLVYLLAPVLCFLIIDDLNAADEKIELTLQEAINISLRENLSLAQEYINLKMSEAEIKVKKGAFDPSLEFGANESYKKSPSASILVATEERAASTDIGIGGKINTGTIYELKWTNERIRSNSEYLTTNPYYTSELALSLTQPLLKGLGREIQESNLNIAKNNLEISRLALNDKSTGIIADTTRAYWDLAFAIYNLDVSELSLKLASNLLSEIKAKIDAGTLAPVEIYKAEAEVSSREEVLLKSKKSVSDAADRLRAVMNLRNWQVELIPIEKISVSSEVPDIENTIETAFKNRKDYKRAIIEQKNKEIMQRYYQNQRFPDLSLTGSVGLNGLNGNYGDTLDKFGSGDYYSWQFGLSLKIPIGNREAEGNYLKAKYEVERSSINLKTIEQNIISEVREACRAVRLASESIKAANKTRVASEKRLEVEEGRFRVGMATINDVLKYQEEYAKALASERKAAIDYARSAIELEKVRGTLRQSTAQNP